jgi:hypothetical protein
MDDRIGDTPSADESLRRAKGATQDAAHDIKEAARDAVGSIKDKTLQAAESAQAKAADQARTAASALREAADGFDGDKAWLQSCFRKSAEGLDHLTSALHRGDIRQTLGNVSDFARRQPAIFLGLSVAAGFALARIGKTALEQVQPQAAADPAEEAAVAQSGAPAETQYRAPGYPFASGV